MQLRLAFGKLNRWIFQMEYDTFFENIASFGVFMEQTGRK